MKNNEKLWRLLRRVIIMRKSAIKAPTYEMEIIWRNYEQRIVSSAGVSTRLIK